MQKDLKIGLAVGLGLAAAAVIWVATRPSMSPEARIRQLHESRTEDVPSAGANALNREQDARDAAQPVVSVIPRSPEPNALAAAPALRQMPPAEPNAGSVPPPVVESVAAKEPNSPQDGSVDSAVHEQTQKIETQRFHVVRRGDTLSEISQTYYGSSAKWRKIFEANKETIKNPDRLSLGQKLIIPD